MEAPTAPANYMPFGQPEGFEEAEHTFFAFQPANEDAPRTMIVQAYNADGELVKSAESNMSYPNIFGIDIADLTEFEKVTDALIVELGGKSLFANA